MLIGEDKALKASQEFQLINFIIDHTCDYLKKLDKE